MPGQQLDPHKVLGGQGLVYRRKEGGSWYLYFWAKNDKKRVRHSLNTTDLALAIRVAEGEVLEALQRQKAGQKVFAATLGEVVDAYETVQSDRLERGEVRSTSYVRERVRTFRRHLDALYGLDTSVAELTQADWDNFVPWRLKSGVALDTVRVETSHLRGLISKVGLKLGALVVPEFNLHVPKSKRSRRNTTFTASEFHELLQVVHKYPSPDTADGAYVRDWALGSAQARKRVPKKVQQDLEFTRRVLLRYFVEVSAASGCRPHELTGEVESALRWRDVEFLEKGVQVSHAGKAPTLKEVAFLKVREQTKTGERTVSTTAGKYLSSLKKWSKFSGPNDFVFADQTGLRAGEPVYLDALRLHWREVLRRLEFDRFKADLYSLRHFFATQRLQSGAPPLLVAKTLGHSLQELTKTYEHVLLEDEAVVSQVWRTNTPPELLKLGVVVGDPEFE